jgi:hypothetical protein
MMQVQPGPSIFLRHAETDPTLIFIIFLNIGLGIAYQLRFNIEKDIRDYGSNAVKIAERGLYKDGMNFCPPIILPEIRTTGLVK